MSSPFESTTSPEKKTGLVPTWNSKKTCVFFEFLGPWCGWYTKTMWCFPIFAPAVCCRQRWLLPREPPRYSTNCQQPRLTGGIDGGADGPSSRWKAENPPRGTHCVAVCFMCMCVCRYIYVYVYIYYISMYIFMYRYVHIYVLFDFVIFGLLSLIIHVELYRGKRTSTTPKGGWKLETTENSSCYVRYFFSSLVFKKMPTCSNSPGLQSLREVLINIDCI